MNDNGGNRPLWLTLLGVLSVLGIALAFWAISWLHPSAFECPPFDKAHPTACSEIVRNYGLAVGGLLAVITAAIALYFNWRRTQTDRLRLTNDTYVKAIEQLSSEAMEVRIGAMYALERIAYEEQLYHWPIIQTLAAYIRERAPWPPRPASAAKGLDAIAAAAASIAKPASELEPPPPEPAVSTEPPPPDPEEPHRTPTDIQTALTIIGTRKERWREKGPNLLQRQAPKIARHLRKWRDRSFPRSEFLLGWVDRRMQWLERVPSAPILLEPGRIDLRHTDLRYVALSGAGLRRASLRGTDFYGANLSHAKFENVDLSHSNFNLAILKDVLISGGSLRNSIFIESNLINAKFHFLGSTNNESDSHITRVQAQDVVFSPTGLIGADLSGGDFSRSSFANIDMIGLKLNDVIFFYAKFTNANLQDAELRKADLRQATITGGSNLARADLRRARLERAELGGADLLGAHFTKHPRALGAVWDMNNPPNNCETIILDPT